MLKSNQINNKLYNNLKQVLRKNIENKCFRDYGFIVEIYEILDYNTNQIAPERLSGSVNFNISFSCKLCNPLVNNNIICKITGINQTLIRAENGPLIIVITQYEVNKEKFYIDNINNMRYKSDDKNIVVENNMFIVATITSKAFSHKDIKILCKGYLNDIATKEQIEKYYDDIYKIEEIDDNDI
jgi:DNA-directed RNA polymerase subunit E'/Rpb7